MLERIIIAGAGGQGIMLFGKVIAQSAMADGRYVTWIPAYGPEVRGGSAHCAVTVSDGEIGSPYIDEVDILVVMNAVALLKFKDRVRPSGLLMSNSSFEQSRVDCRGLSIIRHPFTDIAIRLGNIRVANMVALGCLLAKKKIVPIASVVEAMRQMAPKDKPELFDINYKALMSGQELT